MNGQKKSQKLTAVQDWKNRMSTARSDLPEGIGQQDVLNWITSENPELDRLTNATRWRNAWLKRVADPEITLLVEKASIHFKEKSRIKKERLSRQKLIKIK
jgi:hypothetical protein